MSRRVAAEGEGGDRTSGSDPLAAPGAAGRCYDGVLNPALHRVLRPSDRVILDVGCGGGTNGRWLRSQPGIERVDGLTASKEELVLASRRLDHVLLWNLERDDLPPLERRYDLIVFCHVLEHLAQPWSVVQRFVPLVGAGGRMFVVVPNVGYWRIRVAALRGRFEYTEGGALDRTHLRFFTHHSVRRLLVPSGFEVVDHWSDGHLPLGLLRSLLPERLAERLDRWAARTWPNLLGHQTCLLLRGPGSAGVAR
ncbi:MAG TPA: class I SAM-dependent methyltransferase [Thermoanaerobaculia bacterium]|nr:class I SAM-dependent methyltransferase [Thermoanaerobaculia bacterium]